MSNRLQFEDLVGLVRSSRDTERLQREGGAADFIGVPTEGVRHFVAPDIDIDEDSLDSGADVLLVSAPAAVGKSSIARELGLRTGSMVWDLSHFSLGSSFFSGTLVDAFGIKGLDAVRRGLVEGALTLILDAADEALVRAGASNFEAALGNLVSLISGTESSGPSAVILGRPDTIDETYSILDGRGVRAQVLRVAFFSEDQARSFVRAKAQRDDRAGIAENELDQFLTDFFSVVGTAVGAGDWDSSESFLGYAPVLDALGAFYREQENPLKRLSEIRHGASSAHVWDLLLEVIESILDRESEKFGGAFGGGDPRKEAFGRAAYSRAAQLTLLLSEEPDAIEISPPDFPEAEDSWVFEELTPQVRAWYQEHPFLRGPDDEPNPLLRFASAAFRDYAIAASFVAIEDSDAARLLDYWLDARVAPSPILSRFSMSEHLGLDLVPADIVTMVADSHASGFLESSRLEIDIHQASDGEDEMVIDLVLVENGAERYKMQSRTRGSEPLSLTRAVARTTIDAPSSTLVVGSGAQDFLLGPDVSINCAQFNAEAAEVRVRTVGDRVNELRTNRLLGSARRVSGAGPEGLHVKVPSAVFPWQAYRVEPAEGNAVTESDLYWAGLDVRKNFKWFARESMVGGGLNYPVSAMETILSKHRASTLVHDFWLKRGYLTRKGASWVLELPNVSGADVAANNIQDADYRAMLSDFVDWSRAK